MTAKITPTQQTFFSSEEDREESFNKAEGITRMAISDIANQLQERNFITDQQRTYYYTFLMAKRISVTYTADPLHKKIKDALTSIALFISDNNITDLDVPSIQGRLVFCIQKIRAAEIQRTKAILQAFRAHRTPLFKSYCNVDIHGPSNLVKFMEKIKTPAPNIPVKPAISAEQEIILHKMRLQLVRGCLEALQAFNQHTQDPCKRGLKVLTPDEMADATDFSIFLDGHKIEAICMKIKKAGQGLFPYLVDESTLSDVAIKKVAHTLNVLIKMYYDRSTECRTQKEILKDGVIDLLEKLARAEPIGKALLDKAQEDFFTLPYYYPASTLGHFQIWNYQVRLSFILYRTFHGVVPSRKGYQERWVHLDDERCFVTGLCIPYDSKPKDITTVPYNQGIERLCTTELHTFYQNYTQSFWKRNALSMISKFTPEIIQELLDDISKEGVTPF